MALKKKGVRTDIFGDRCRARIASLSPRLQTVARYIDAHRESVAEATAIDIAAATGTSDATVIRAVQALGFTGLRDLKLTLAEWAGPAINSAAKMSATVSELACDINASIDFVLLGHQQACHALAQPENRQAVAQAVALLSEARQVALFGINASGILADYSARMFSRIGLPATTLNRTGIALAEQLLSLQRGDVLVMMAQKSAHREGVTALKEARKLGIPVILLTHAMESAFAREADIVINVPRGGEGGRMPLHGTVLVCLEMLILSVASVNAGRTVKTMKRIQELNRSLKPGTKR
ncbi:MurR/RpiR family transcriptional regulator [Pantoea sp. RIT413]|uniref:MurR/RpiR family transcriptional regulator n=1 Tax=Pantoea TaxID=53335 RepID=UPI000D3C9E29|nr:MULTISPECIES: MurR/RpiR family transcriptional regulator [Pantoea]KAA6044516.1 MurR/RpiR family transcriptional regulator [Pantoea sp. Bo_7]KAA6090293.1 MurR/RpiR family transcriptional regulator [Pantoea sp. Bo_10]RAU33711.1 MurR/RpiR family transcriptional regulator [Pantoea sp. RIT 413]